MKFFCVCEIVKNFIPGVVAGVVVGSGGVAVKSKQRYKIFKYHSLLQFDN